VCTYIIKFRQDKELRRAVYKGKLSHSNNSKESISECLFPSHPLAAAMVVVFGCTTTEEREGDKC